MKAFEKRERTFYEPVKLGSKGRLGKLILLGALAYGAYKLFKKYTNEDNYQDFDTDLGEKIYCDATDSEEEKFADKILKAAKRAGKDVEEKVGKIKKSLND